MKMSKQKLWRINIFLLALASVFIFVASKMSNGEQQNQYEWQPTENVPQIVK